MKKQVVLGCLLGWMLCPLLMAQELPIEVSAAWERGDAHALSNFFNNKVELVVGNGPLDLDKTLAAQKLSVFFTENKVSEFRMIHQCKRDTSAFIIGTLITDKGAFRVNCYFKRVKNKYIIYQIRIDSSNG